MPGRYDHLQPHIEAFFEKRGRKIIVEPRGCRGPDLEDVPFLDVVGEIKHAGELARDLKGYWSQWNSNQRFGGKSFEYKLRSEFNADVEQLSLEVKGWLAVVHGQLRHYVRTVGLSQGWLVVEEYARWEAGLSEALEYLRAGGKIGGYRGWRCDGIGLVEVRWGS